MSKYLKKFSTVADYNTYINGSPDLPNVSYITATGDSEVNSAAKEAVKVSAYDGATTFYWKSYVKSVDIPYGYTGIGNFNGITSLTSVTIPDSVTSIDYYAFSNCSSLTSVTIPDSVTSIGDNAFYNCSGLTSVVIPNNTTTISPKAFQGCSRLTSVTIGNGVTTIDYYAFQGCSSLTSVVIPNNTTTISQKAFQGCSGLTSVTIGNGVTTIGYYAFMNCGHLASVTVEATTPPTLGSQAFNSNAPGRKIYVPASSVETYKTASGWSDYASDIEAIPSE